MENILFLRHKNNIQYPQIGLIKSMDLSIIVPVYRVERYIHACIESIYMQGLDEKCYEVIIVDDGSTDKSIEVIADIIEEHSNIIVINQENQGLSVARNNGIATAKGDYILMLDPDDLLIEDSLLIILKRAIETKADLVVADFLIMNDEEIAKFQGIAQNHIEFKEKSGEQLFLKDLNPNHCYVWHTLYRREFILKEHLTFEPKVCYEDIPFTHECYLKARKCLRTRQLLNLYRKGRQGAITSSFSREKAQDFCTVIAETWKLRSLPGLSPEVLRKLNDNVYALYSSLIYKSLHTIKKASIMTQTINDLKQKAPDLKFTNGMKQKTETFLFWSMPHLYIYLRMLHWKWIECQKRVYK